MSTKNTLLEKKNTIIVDYLQVKNVKIGHKFQFE